ncbi:hypothetical protein TSUD_303430, partial [Trifolium subterraneum]
MGRGASPPHVLETSRNITLILRQTVVSHVTFLWFTVVLDLVRLPPSLRRSNVLQGGFRVWEWVEACHVHLHTEEDTLVLDLPLIVGPDATVDIEAEALPHPLLHTNHALPLSNTKKTIH